MNDGLRFDVAGAAGPRRYFASLTAATLAHAYLFSGDYGVGKKSFARRLAQSLLCTAPERTSVLGYDGTCASCRLFEAGENARHPDFLEHEGSIKIGDSDGGSGFYENEDLTARDLVRQLSMQSYTGGRRVLLLGDVEFATHHSANALLKFFEEPPRDVVLILTTPAPGRLLATIRSRLIEIVFAKLSTNEVIELLRARGYDDERAHFGAVLGQGSAARAIAALAGEGESLRDAIAQWFFSVIAGESPESGWATRETLDEGLETLKSFVRDWVALANAGSEAPLLALDHADALRRLKPPPAGDALAMLSKIGDAQRLARTNVSPAMVSEIVRMALSGKAN